MRVSPLILSFWRERFAGRQDWRVHLLLRTRTERATALKAIEESVAALLTGVPDPDADGPSIGAWRWLTLTEGILIQVRGADAFPDVLSAFAGQLERRGVDGLLSSWEQPPPELPPHHADMLECRLTVRGARRHHSSLIYQWLPDPAAQLRVLTAAEAWCRREGADASLAIGAGSIAPVPFSPVDQLPSSMREVFLRDEHSRLTATSKATFRCVNVIPRSGRISLVLGRIDACNRWWEQPVQELTELVRDHAGDLAYGFIRRGWHVMQTYRELGMPDDWPRRTFHKPYGPAITVAAFDDLVVPDAFGIQWLGPGFRDRLDLTSDWHSELIGDGALLRHDNEAAWFSAPFVPKKPDPTTILAPEILQEARVALAPILYVRGALLDLGFADMIDH